MYVPSLLLIDDKLLIVQDNGVARLLNAHDGAEIWHKRLGGDFSASPVCAGDYMFATNERGKTFVFRVAPRFEMMAENQLGNSGFASPVICGRRLYLRTEDQLYCIGES